VTDSYAVTDRLIELHATLAVMGVVMCLAEVPGPRYEFNTIRCTVRNMACEAGKGLVEHHTFTSADAPSLTGRDKRQASVSRAGRRAQGSGAQPPLPIPDLS
jgi:hypothetical protein